jgi:putative DNA primase/helicase
VIDNAKAVILPHHAKELVEGSGLTLDTIKAAGIHSETNRDRIQRLLDRKAGLKNCAPAIVIPFVGPDGQNGYYRIKSDTPRKDRNGGAIKYESPAGIPSRAYFPPGVLQYIGDTAQELILVEGEKKALKLTQEGFPAIGLVGVWGWKRKDNERLIADLEAVNWKGRRVFIAFDSDVMTKDEVKLGESRLSVAVATKGSVVRCVRFPDGPEGRKQGADDFFVAHGADGKRLFRQLLDEAAEPDPVPADQQKQSADNIDPAEEAAEFLATGKKDGVYRLRFWRGGYIWWSRGAYSHVPPSEVRGRLVQHINQNFRYLTTSVTGNVIDQVKAQAILGYGCDPPAWIEQVDGFEEWRPQDCLVARNGIVNLPALVAGDERHMIPPTPRLFCQASLDYDFTLDAPKPERWFEFLGQVWPDDQECIDTLQEIFGLLLTGDTSYQKIFVLIGPTRCGKGTIARALAGLIGTQNVAGPTLASFGTNFGLWPLLGKPVAIVSDARLSGKTDQAVVTERLLSISGEDQLTVDRKNQEPVTGKLPTRLMILSNELPRLTDASGALIGRMLLLPMRQTFYGREDRHLGEKLLEERAGILLWAIAGWARLQERGHFVQPASGDDMREQLVDLASPVGAFVRDCCVVEPGKRVSVESLYARYREWCQAKGREPSTEQILGRDLAAAVPGIKRTRPRDDNDERFRAYEGIALSPGF